MADDKDSGLNDYPSPTNPLGALGIDPDDLRTNPDIMSALARGEMPAGWMPGMGPSPASAALANQSKPTDTMASLPTGASAKEAGALGGAGAQPAPSSAPTPAPMATPNASPATETTPTPAPNPVFTQATGNEMQSANELYRFGEAQSQGTDPATLAAQTARDKAIQAQNTLTSQASDKQYQPSRGQRIWRGVRGGLEGFLIGGIPGAGMGILNPGSMPGDKAYGAPNDAYERAAATAANEVKTRQQALDEAAANFKQIQDARAAGGKSITLAGEGFGRVATEENLADKAATDALKAQNETPAAKAALSRAEFADRWTQLQSIEGRVGKLPGEQQAYYLAKGEMPNPREPRQPSAEEIEVGRAQVLFTKQHGRAPTYDEYVDLVRGLKGRNEGGDENSDKANDIVADSVNEKTAYQQQWTRNDDGSYTKVGSFAGDPKNTITGQEYNAKVDGFRTKANEKLDKIGFEWNPQGQLVATRQTRGAGQTPPRPTGPLPAGADGWALNRKTNRWHSVDSKTKRDYGEAPGQ